MGKEEADAGDKKQKWQKESKPENKKYRINQIISKV